MGEAADVVADEEDETDIDTVYVVGVLRLFVSKLSLFLFKSTKELSILFVAVSSSSLCCCSCWFAKLAKSCCCCCGGWCCCLSLCVVDEDDVETVSKFKFWNEKLGVRVALSLLDVANLNYFILFLWLFLILTRKETNSAKNRKKTNK